MLHPGDPMPPLDAARWVGERPDLRGAPVLLHVWSQSCPSCKQDLPAMARWAERYGPRGLRVVGVHVRTEGGGDDRVEELAAREGLRHPIARGGAHNELAAALGVRFVPTYLLFDREGRLRHAHAGPRALLTTQAAIERLLDVEARPPA